MMSTSSRDHNHTVTLSVASGGNSEQSSVRIGAHALGMILPSYALDRKTQDGMVDNDTLEAVIQL